MQDPVFVLESARRRLNELAPLAQELNAASDRFTKDLRAIESELVKFNLGVEVTLGYSLDGPELPDDAGPNDCAENHYLGFGRHGRRWTLLARLIRKTVSDDEYLEEVPLLEAPRDLRIAAAEQIDALLDLIAKEARKKIDSLNKVTDESPLPKEWEKLHLGLDDAGRMHVLKGGKTLCGAQVITTSFDHVGRRRCRRCGDQAVFEVHGIAG